MREKTESETNLAAIKKALAMAAMDDATRALGWATRAVRWVTAARWGLFLPAIAVALALIIPPLAVRTWAANVGLVIGFGQCALLGWGLTAWAGVALLFTGAMVWVGKWWDEDERGGTKNGG